MSKGRSASSDGSGTCCLVPSPCPLLQGLILVAAAPKERTAEGGTEGALISKPALAPPSSSPLKQMDNRQGLVPHLGSTSLFLLPRHMAVNEVNLLRVSISWRGRTHQQVDRDLQACPFPSVPGPLTPPLTTAILLLLPGPPRLPGQLRYPE